MKELGKMKYHNLFAGHYPKKAMSGVVALGQDLKIGSLIGRRLFALGAVTPAAGNTGNGTLDNLALGSGVMHGVYVVECISGSGPGTFRIVDPHGRVYREFEVGDPYTGPLSMTVQNGSTQFTKGDFLTVEVVPGDERLTLIDPTAHDGTQFPGGVLYEDIDSTAQEKIGTYFRTGGFMERAIILPAGLTVDDVRETCAERSIYLEESVSADLP